MKKTLALTLISIFISIQPIKATQQQDDPPIQKYSSTSTYFDNDSENWSVKEFLYEIFISPWVEAFKGYPEVNKQ